MSKILISACLLGENVKYNGGNNRLDAKFIIEGIEKNIFIPFCPEVAGGLPVPRVPCEQCNGKVIDKNGVERTANFNKGAKKALKMCQENGVKYALLKERSPSCGVAKIYDGTFSKTVIDGSGVTTSLLQKNGIECFSEDSLRTLERRFYSR